jgi:hypothetical protein
MGLFQNPVGVGTVSGMKGVFFTAAQQILRGEQ